MTGAWLRPSRDRLIPAAGWTAIGLVAFLAYAWQADHNPPGFYLDEASLAYNAWSIAQTGADEHGTAWPLFFQTWYPSVSVNPTYVYLLAIVFKVVGPSILAARLLSVALVFLASLLAGAVVWRTTRHRGAALLTGGLALMTPWLFEVGRLVFEVALFPLVLVAFLLVLRGVANTRDWSRSQVVLVALLLGLVTYTYTAGRVIGPLLAVGMLLLVPRVGIRSLVAAWTLYGVTMLPVLAFNATHPGVLGARADIVGYLKPGVPLADLAAHFVNQVLVNIDLRRVLLVGDPNIRHHVPVMGSFLVAALALALAGIDRIFHGGWRDGWQRYLLYGLVVSLVPASLTLDEFHTLRLIGVPVFLLVFAGLGAARLWHGARWNRVVLAALIGLGVAQGTWSVVQFHRFGPDRGAAFDAAFPPVFEAALATGARPIYLSDLGVLPGYIEAYWYGALRGLDRSSFVRLEPGRLPPTGAIVLGTNKVCGACEVIREGGDYIVYRAGGARGQGIIPNGDFEETGGAVIGAPGTAIFGWSGSEQVTLEAGGAATPKAHLVIRHGSDATTTKQASSASAAVRGGSVVSLGVAVRRGDSPGPGPQVTVALVETDAQGRFVTWHTVSTRITAPGWQTTGLPTIQLDPATAFVSVSCYLEPGAPGDEASFDDVVVKEVR